MIATDELEYTLNRIILFENNIDDQNEKEFTHIVKENLSNIINQFKALEKQIEANKVKQNLNTGNSSQNQ